MEKSHHLSLDIYLVTSSFPASERYGLCGQLSRATVSIGSNIAEGAAKSSDAEFRRFLGIAMNSASEVDYQLLLSKDLGFIDEETQARLTSDVQDVKRMLGGLVRRLSTQEK